MFERALDIRTMPGRGKTASFTGKVIGRDCEMEGGMESQCGNLAERTLEKKC
jgi:hypothetical protein